MATQNWIRGAEAEILLRQYEREVLDVYHRGLALWNDSPSQSVYAILAQHDSLAIAEQMAMARVPARNAMPQLSARMAQIIQSREDALSQSLRWVLGGNDVSVLNPQADRGLIGRAGDFASHASVYCDIADFHRAFGRAGCTIAVNPDERIVRFVPADTSDGFHALAGFLEAAETRNETARRSPSAAEHQRRLKEIYVTALTSCDTADGHIRIADMKRVFTDKNLEAVSKQLPIDVLPLGSEVNLGVVRVGELDNLWRCLRLWSMVSTVAYMLKSGSGAPQEECMSTQVVRKEDFIRSIASVSGVAAGHAEYLVECMSWRPGEPAKDVMLWPLISVGSQIAWSPKVLLASKYRRNFLKMLAKDREKRVIADSAFDALGEHTTKRLGERLRKAGYVIKIKTDVASTNEEGDIDIAAWHPSSPGDVLVIEVKGCVPADEVNEVFSVTKEAIGGQTQLDKVIRIVSGYGTEALTAAFPFLPKNRSLRYLGLVVLYDGLPANTYSHDRFPCVDLDILLNKVRPKCFYAPKDLWDACRAKQWLPKAEQSNLFLQRKVGDITYELPAWELAT